MSSFDVSSNGGASLSSPLVSVAFAAYGHENYIEETMLSVFLQTYDRLELVIVDDRSKDATFEVAQALAAQNWFRDRFESVTIVQNERNLGAHASINRAMALSRGDYISLLNSDDSYVSTRIEKLVAACRLSGAECAFTGVLPIDDKGKPIRSGNLAESIVYNPLRSADNLPSLSCGFLRFQLTSSSGNLFLSRRLSQKIGGFIDLRYCHDWDYMMRLISVAEPYFIEEPLYRYRLHDRNSFRSLAGVAEVESEIVLRRYYLGILLGKVRNRRAPSPHNWPGVF
ncbi:MAG: glycosyltransferase family 2 protein, partial [Methylocystaceae bacterium]